MFVCVCVCVSYLKGQKSTRHFGWKPLEVWVLLNSILLAALESISVSPHKQNNQAAQEERKRQKLSQPDKGHMLRCTPQAYKSIAYPALRPRKQTGVSNRDINGLMDGGVYMSKARF